MRESVIILDFRPLRRNLKTLVFILKTHQMFSVHTTPEEFRNETIIRHVGFRKSLAEKSRDYGDVIAQEKLHFQNVFVHT